MPELTPKLGIKKPLGNETVSRAAFNENWDIIDQNAASQADLAAHLADKAHIGINPVCRVKNSANQSVSSGVVFTASWDSDILDNNNIHDTATNNSRLTCKTPGVYLIMGSVNFASSTSGIRVAYIRKNGTSTVKQETAQPIGETHVGIFDIQMLSANDYVELQAYQNSGNELDMLSNSFFSMVMIA
ncbi:MAG TPA: hypothetical protein PK728_08760 [Bacillota bacterium]|nr:hypothetical protein [Bacillota bacterium]